LVRFLRYLLRGGSKKLLLVFDPEPTFPLPPGCGAAIARGLSEIV